ncbi:MAG: hypothetical protein Kow00121_27830 [Elainellaceae cyanobacterium]
MVMNVGVDINLVSEALQKTLDDVAEKMADRKEEVVDLLSDEQPTKSRQVDLSYVRCMWWEGCYYCQDEQNRWHRVKCFT